MDNTAVNLNTLKITRLYSASKEKLFEMWTNPALIKTWFAQGLTQEEGSITSVEVNLRVGGQIRIEMQEPEGNQRIAHGIYKKIIKPDTLEFSWSWADPGSNSNSSDTLVRIDFNNTPEKTEISLSYGEFESTESRDIHEQAWTKCLDKLELVI